MVFWQNSEHLDDFYVTLLHSVLTSSQAKGTNSTLFLRNEVELVPLACEDVSSECIRVKL